MVTPSPFPRIDALAGTLVLGALLDELRTAYGAFELCEHWTQGEFHHDLALRIPERVADLPGTVIVIATNCNGGVKEVLCFDEVPARGALWSMRCPSNPDFKEPAATPLARSFTIHWFDPCELLLPDARSELLPEHRVRQDGGGWTASGSETGRGGCGPRRPT